MSFNSFDLCAMYIGVYSLREECEAELDELPMSDPERNSLLDDLKQYNGTLRKLKAFMRENGVEIPEL